MQAAFLRRPAVTRGWPLLATLGVHLLLAWSWRIAHPPVQESRGERVVELVPIAPPAPAEPRLRAKPPPPPPTSKALGARADKAPAFTSRAPEPVAPPPAAPATAADPFAITAAPAPAESALDALVGRATRDAVIIDRELRKGKSGVPEVAGTPIARFRAALEGAHKDSRRSLSSDSYTAPDGQVIYRFRQGGKVWCRIGGGVKPRIGGAEGGGATMFDTQGGGGSAGAIRCPSHADWKGD